MIQGIVTSLCVCLLAVGGPTQKSVTQSDWTTTARSDLEGFPNRLLDDGKTVFFNVGNDAILLGAGLASVLMHNEDIDRHIDRYFTKHETFGDTTDEILYDFGSPVTHVSVAALWYGLSAVYEDDFNRERAMTMLSALTITDVVTLGLKAARHNERPNGEDWSWPSGHTASSFAVASVLHEFYGPTVGLAAYAGASLVAWRMMDHRDHWASDVVFGAALGCVVGHTVAGKHERLDVGGFEIDPFFGDSRTPALGISLLRRF